MRVPAARDIMQEGGKELEVPEIRVWFHPHRVGRRGDDYYQVCDSFKQAMELIEAHPKEAEPTPMLAFRGYELNLWEMKTEEQVEKEAKKDESTRKQNPKSETDFR